MQMASLQASIRILEVKTLNSWLCGKIPRYLYILSRGRYTHKRKHSRIRSTMKNFSEILQTGNQEEPRMWHKEQELVFQRKQGACLLPDMKTQPHLVRLCHLVSLCLKYRVFTSFQFLALPFLKQGLYSRNSCY